MTSFITLPGIGGSAQTHWQSHWEADDPSFTRFQPADWDQPDLDDWQNALERAIDGSTTPPVLVAHSLACLLLVHSAGQIAGRVKGAFLVSVPDPSSASFPAEAASFANPPGQALSFPALVIASSNDHYATPAYVRKCAGEWGAGLIEIGACGHINDASGLGSWPLGRMLLDAFCAGLRD